MTFHELQQEVLQLPTDDRWQLVQSVLASLQAEKVISVDSDPLPEVAALNLSPWTQSLIGIIKDEPNLEGAYFDYLEEKYR